MNFTAGLSDAPHDELPRPLPQPGFQVARGSAGWALQASYHAQADQFDRPDTLYVLAQDGQGRVTGCARLLPTTQPYLLGQFFPQLLAGQPAPCAAPVWELTRLAAVDHHQRSSAALSQVPAATAIGLLQAVTAAAAEQGAGHLITMATIGMERLLRRAGLQVHRAGPPAIVDGHPLCACWITLATAD